MKTKIIIFAAALMMLFLCTASTIGTHAEESTQKAVEIGQTDYENLVMRVYPNDNTIVYMSIDNGKTWNEVDGTPEIDENQRNYIETDISWASPTSNVKLMFKGNIEKTEVSCTLPKQESLKVKFDKVSGDFEITTGSDAENFKWRKATDYKWNDVSMNKESQEYKDFLTLIGSFRFKGIKLVFKTGQVMGTNNENMGKRPSKEVNVSVTKFAAAPSLKVNVVKLTLNTKATMEYTNDISSNNWKTCEKGMTINEIAPDVFITESGDPKDTTLFFRVAKTEKKAASLISSISLPAQTAKPSVGADGTDVTCTENTTDKKYEIKFLTATAVNLFEYCIVTPGNEFDLNKAKWKTIKAAKTITLTQKKAPDGTVVYFRFKGTTENAKKNIELKLPSEYATFTIKWTSGSDKE